MEEYEQDDPIDVYADEGRQEVEDLNDQGYQMSLFVVRDEPDDVWQGAPAFEQRDLTPWRVVTVQLRSEADYIAFKEAIGADKMRMAGGLNSHNFWYPPIQPKDWKAKEWVSEGAEALTITAPAEDLDPEGAVVVDVADEPPGIARHKLVKGGGVPGGHRVLYDGVREPFITPMRECNSIALRPSDVVADIGAYVGTYAIKCARFPVKEVRAYEPTPGTFGVLSLTKLPNLRPILAAVVGDDRATVELHISRGIGVTNSTVLSNRKAGLITVPAINYAEAVRGATVVKIDVEGAEYDYSSIVQTSLRAIIIDFHPIPGVDWVAKAEALIASFIAAGFRTVVEPDWTNGWSCAGSWIRVLPDPGGNCATLYYGDRCCGCGVTLKAALSKALCPPCFGAWSKRHREGYALAEAVE